MPTEQLAKLSHVRISDDLALKAMPGRLGEVEDLNRLAREIMTRDGVEIWRMNEAGKISNGKWYQPQDNKSSEKNSYCLVSDKNGSRTALMISHPDLPHTIRVYNYRTGAVDQSVRFLADMTNLEDRLVRSSEHQSPKCQVVCVKQSGDGWIIELNDQLQGKYNLRPVKIQGRERWLFYSRSDH